MSPFLPTGAYELVVMTEDENEHAHTGCNAVDALHRATGCFYALLSVLQAPLAQFVAKTRTNGLESPLESESKYKKIALVGLEMHLASICETGFSAEPSLGLTDDVDKVSSVLVAAFDGADTDVSSFDDGIAAVVRLLGAVGASEDAVRQAHALVVMLHWHSTSSSVSKRGGGRAEGEEIQVEDADGKAAVGKDDMGESRSKTPMRSTASSADEQRTASVTVEEQSGQAHVSAATQSEELRNMQRCMDRRDFGTAVLWINKELTHAAPKTVNHAKLLVLRARCRCELQQFSHVVNDCRDALAIDKTLVEAYRYASLALQGLGRLSEAHSMCHAGLKVAASDAKLKALEREISRKASLAHAEKKTPSVSASEACSASQSDSSQAPPPSKMVAKPAKVSVADAMKLIERGDLKAAHTSLTKTLKLVGDSAPAKRLNVLGHRARCLLGLKQFDAVINDAREGLQLKADWLEGRRLLCKAFMGLKRWHDALVECDAVLRGAPKDVIFQGLKPTITKAIATSTPVVSATANAWKAPVKALVQAGLTHVEKQQYAQGDASFTKALSMLDALSSSSTDSTIVAAHVKVLGHSARCRLAMEKYSTAASDARAGIRLQSGWVEGYRLLCHALMGMGQWMQALTACERVLELAPGDAVFAKHVIVLRAKCAARSECQSPPSPVAHFDALLRQAFKLEQLRQYEAAALHCSEAIALLHESTVSAQLTKFQKAAVFINRSRCRLAMNQLEAALQDARTGLAHNADWPEGRRVECRALMALGRWDQALQACQRVLEVAPADAAFQVHAESIAKELPQPSPHQSSPTTPQPITSSSETAASLRTEGLALALSRDFRNAETKYSQAIARLESSRSKKHARYFGDRARCRIELEKFHEALDDAREGLACDPDWIEGNRLLCRAFMGLSQWHKAAQMCERVLATAPQDTIFQTIKVDIDSKLQPDEPKKGNAPVHKTACLDSSAQSKKSGVSVARMRELEQFASQGSIAAQRFVSAQHCLQRARSRFQGSRIEAALWQCRLALRRWPQLEIPRDITDTLRTIVPHYVIACGGAMLYFRLQALERTFTSRWAERAYWQSCVERYPRDYELHAKLAWVLYQDNELDAALEHAEEALKHDCARGENILPGPETDSSCRYIRAMCAPVQATVSPLSWLASVWTGQPAQPRTRMSELLAFIQRQPVDDEWMPHACYSLGVLHLAKCEYERATQYYYIGTEAEMHRTKLRLFAEINETTSRDKAALQAALAGPHAVLSISQQFEAVCRAITCTWCQQTMTVKDYFDHKRETCSARPRVEEELEER